MVSALFTFFLINQVPLFLYATEEKNVTSNYFSQMTTLRYNVSEERELRERHVGDANARYISTGHAGREPSFP